MSFCRVHNAYSLYMVNLYILCGISIVTETKVKILLYKLLK